MNNQADEDDSLDRAVTFDSSKRQRAKPAVSLGDEQTAGADGESSISDVRGFQDENESITEVVDFESRYEIRGQLGQGGMGDVLQATDRRLQRQVAIKRLREGLGQSRKAIQRFLTEARAVAALNHFNVVQVYDFGRDGQGFFIVMELVDGGSLADRIRNHETIDVATAVDIVVQVCGSLVQAHAHGITHRDIKPANILITRDGVPKLTDFGLARLESADTEHTQAGVVLGTIDFMPPEQRRDATDVDGRSDIWSLAATLYQLLTGNSPRVIRSDRIPEALRDVVLKALEDDPDSRFQTAQDFRDALIAAQAKELQSKAITNLAPGQCAQCGHQNSAGNEFCLSCGVALTEGCPGCGETIDTWAKFCGKCGVDVAAKLTQRLDQLKNEKQRIARLREQGRCDEIEKRLTAVASLKHSALKAYSQWARTTLEQIRAENLRMTLQRDKLLIAAAFQVNDGNYAEAVRQLEQVPEAVRNDKVIEKLRIAKQSAEEVHELNQRIRAKLSSKQYDELLPLVNRLLQLKPNDPNAIDLLRKLQRRAQGQPVRADTSEKTPAINVIKQKFDADLTGRELSQSEATLTTQAQRLSVDQTAVPGNPNRTVNPSLQRKTLHRVYWTLSALAMVLVLTVIGVIFFADGSTEGTSEVTKGEQLKPDAVEKPSVLPGNRGQLVYRFGQLGSPVTSLAFAPDSSFLIAAGGTIDAPFPENRTVEMFDTQTGRSLRRLDGPTAPWFHVVVSLDAQTIAAVAEDHAMRWWNSRTGKQLGEYKPTTNSIGLLIDLDFVSADKMLFCCKNGNGIFSLPDNSLSIINAAVSGQPFNTRFNMGQSPGQGVPFPGFMDGTPRRTVACVVAQTCQRAVILDQSAPSNVLDLGNQTYLSPIISMGYDHDAVAVTSTGNRMILHSPQVTQVQDFDERKILMMLPYNFSNSPNKVADITQDGKMVLTATDSALQVWAVSEHGSVPEVIQTAVPIRAARFSPEGGHVAIGMRDGTVELRRLALTSRANAPPSATITPRPSTNNRLPPTTPKPAPLLPRLELVNDPTQPILIDKVTPNNGKAGDQIEITGKGFKEIQKVNFYEGFTEEYDAKFEVVSEQLLRVVVPNRISGLSESLVIELSAGKAIAFTVPVNASMNGSMFSRGEQEQNFMLVREDEHAISSRNSISVFVRAKGSIPGGNSSRIYLQRGAKITEIGNSSTIIYCDPESVPLSNDDYNTKLRFVSELYPCYVEKLFNAK